MENKLTVYDELYKLNKIKSKIDYDINQSINKDCSSVELIILAKRNAISKAIYDYSNYVKSLEKGNNHEKV